MLIDWFTVGAQALNFLILVWLMKRFLYQPIRHAIDEREKHIAAALADAQTKETDAEKKYHEFQQKNDAFDKERTALMKKATDEASAERQRLIDQARIAADDLSKKRQETLKSDAENLNQAISRHTQDEVFAITRKTLADLATVSLEERMVEVFIRRLREMDETTKALMASAIAADPKPTRLRSAFELPAEQRAAIQNALNIAFSTEISIEFELAPDLICGIEYSANGQKLAWSIADYLTSMTQGIEALLQDKDQAPTPKPEAAP